MSKPLVIDIEVHAFLRLMERSADFGLDYSEAKERAFETVRRGNQAKWKHLSEKNTTYCSYFPDNLSFYVICEIREFEDCVRALIHTVIIEYGRE